jgi:hypothetical protein
MNLILRDFQNNVLEIFKGGLFVCVACLGCLTAVLQSNFREGDEMSC